MKIAVIGAGSIGATLTRKLTRLGHDVSVANSRGPASLEGLGAETGARVAALDDVALDAAIVFLAVPLVSIPTLPQDLLSRAERDVTVVDGTNYVPQQRDGRIDAIEDGLAESAWVAQQLGHPVVKALNTVRAASLASAGDNGTERRIAVPIAGDDPRDVSRVSALVSALGFDPLEAGSLADSWRQQPGTPVYTADLPRDKAVIALAAASPKRPAEWSAVG